MKHIVAAMMLLMTAMWWSGTAAQGQQKEELPEFIGTVASDEFLREGQFVVVDADGNSRKFLYNVAGAPKCIFYDKDGRLIRPDRLGFGDEVTVSYKKRNDVYYALKVHRTKIGKR